MKLKTIKNEWLSYLQIILACFIWGSYGLFVQILPYSPEVIVFFRFLFGSLTLVIFASFTGKLSQLKPSSSWKSMVLIGFVNTFSWLALTKSITYTSVANGFILYYTAPCFVVMLAPFFLNETLEKKSLIALVLCFAGIISVMGYGEITQGGYSWQGNLLGLISGILYATFIIGLKRLPSHCLGLVSNVYMCTVIALVSFPLAFSSLHQVSLSGILILIAAGISIQGIGTTLYMTGLRNVKAQHASILSYLEALFAAIFASLFLGEHLAMNMALGGILILVGGIVVMSKTTKKPTPLVNVASIPEKHSLSEKVSA